MLPVELRISGLHSYLEEQVVDFTALCTHGIFGIFGPTGSGKSTILDAIILALYGEVPRASHGTQGIINQNTAQAAVSFTFELGRGPERRRYRVERVLRRSGEYGAVTHRSRLIVAGENEERVLADKDGAVKAKLQEILGLTAEDFTRAVVLPQGRFAEFLTLRPADRRQMLERIFALDRFGEALRQRVDEALHQARSDLERVIAEQSGLGDCSPATLARAEQELAEAQKAAGAAGRDYRVRQQEREEAARVRALQDQAAGCAARLEELAQEREEIESLAAKLEAAQRAEGLRGLFAQQEELENDLAGRRQRVAELRRELAQAEEKARAAEESYLFLRQQKEKEEPSLLQKRARLETAQREEEELEKWLAEEKEKRDRLKELRQKAAALEREEQRAEQLRQEKETRRKELKERAGQLRVSPRLLELAVEARQLKQETDRLEAEMENEREKIARLAREGELRQKAKNALAERLKEVTAALENLAREAARWQQGEPAGEEELARRRADLAAAKQIIARLAALAREKESVTAQIARLETARAGLERELRERRGSLAALQERAARAAQMCLQARQALEKSRTLQAAAHLARTLEPGKPCPVCGSLFHPAPAKAAGEDPAALEAAVKRAEDEEAAALRACQEAEGALGKLEGALAGLAPQLAPWLERLAGVEREESSCRQQLPPAWLEAAPDDPQEWQRRWQKAEDECQALTAARQKWLSAGEARQARERQQTEEENRLKVELAQVEAGLSALAAQKAEAETKRDELAGRLKERLARLNPLLAALELKEPARLEEHYQDLRRRQKEEQQALDEAAALEGELNRLADLQSKIQQEKQKIETGAQVLENELNNLSRQAGERRRHLDTLTGGVRAAAALQLVSRRLAELQERFRDAENANREAEKLFREAEIRTRGEEEALAAVQNQLTDLLRKLNEKAQKARFATAGEARSALLTPEEKETISRRIQLYREEVARLTVKLRELQEQLGGRRIGPEEYERLLTAEADAQKAWEKAQKEAGAKENSLRQLKERQERWSELEKERERLFRRRELLNELSRLLRARALVDFLARQRLEQLVQQATERLGRLTSYRYALELDGQSGFVLRDDYNGGRRRPVSSLSGGETFQVSLALALALSDQIQRRSRAPLEFFFLDEGFGSLDEQCLETVMNTLERLPAERVTIGLISHVPQMRHRLPRRLIVHPAEPGRRGSRLTLEID